MDTSTALSPLRHRRFEVGDISQRELARRSGVNNATISKIESGGKDLNYQVAKALAPHLRATSGDLLKEMADWRERRGDLK